MVARDVEAIKVNFNTSIKLSLFACVIRNT